MAWAENQPRLWLSVDEILVSTLEILEKTWWKQRNNHDHGALFMKEFTNIETVKKNLTDCRMVTPSCALDDRYACVSLDRLALYKATLRYYSEVVLRTPRCIPHRSPTKRRASQQSKH